jgi:hypothetical protein
MPAALLIIRLPSEISVPCGRIYQSSERALIAPQEYRSPVQITRPHLEYLARG